MLVPTVPTAAPLHATPMIAHAVGGDLSCWCNMAPASASPRYMKARWLCLLCATLSVDAFERNRQSQCPHLSLALVLGPERPQLLEIPKQKRRAHFNVIEEQ